MIVTPNPTDELADELAKIRKTRKSFPQRERNIKLMELVGDPVFDAVETFFSVPKERILLKDSTIYVHRARLACYWLMARAGLSQEEIGGITRRIQGTVGKALATAVSLMELDASFARSVNRAKDLLAGK